MEKKKSSRNSNVTNDKLETGLIICMILVGVILLFNQMQIIGLSASLQGGSSTPRSSSFGVSLAGAVDISNVDVTQITSTLAAVAVLFPELDGVETEADTIAVMIPSGTPEYSEVMGGITFDDPVTSMQYLAKWYPSLKEDVKKNDPETWQRYINLAAAPRGISCEFCCGVGPQGITKDGNLRCGCKHNPAAQSMALGLMKNTDYTDAEILREVLRWKTIYFPRDMIGISLQVAGKDASQLKDLPGMVGGC